MRDLTYPGIVGLARSGFKALGQRIVIEGAANVPTSGGVLLAYNHISYVDFIYGGLAARPSGRLVRFMAKREIFDNKLSGPLMRSMHHIKVDRADGLESYQTALSYLGSGEAVGIFPEATISRAMELKDFKSGAIRIAATAGVPIVPVILWGTQRMLTKDHPRDLTRGRTISIRVGAPLHPTGADAVAELAELKTVMSQLLTESIAAYPAAEQPPGSWWVPASLGGTAPSLTEAAELDGAEMRQRMRRHAEKRLAQRRAKGAKGSKGTRP